MQKLRDLISIIRTLDEKKIWLTELWSTGFETFFTIRVYEPLIMIGSHSGRFYVEGVFMGDIAGRMLTKAQEEKSHKEAYELINAAFPEFSGIGLKNEGYAIFNSADTKMMHAILSGKHVDQPTVKQASKAQKPQIKAKNSVSQGSMFA